ncbi:hypothetical protein F1737_01100 [Methanoplanus sp. FWC-SCC4]|uniref:Dinitrogenase iron-molybdenum cofactor biosynthesis domain-containing protein n=1 Tax=Methanochimaera problematica TaxID=2609417 RepID=A0AA97FB87_9EURY|nr:NifB/NifX family molybdenum-iron cluster-binding protein [Methanoplanus sp. FWC-SCC4]WOF15377.1 hypothetical protein F1737_01100 [Methanoplanus sp. FWC-SCC4]
MIKRVVVAGRGSGGFDDTVSPFFGRCSSFCVVDIGSGGIATHLTIPNEASDIPGSAGVVAAGNVIDFGVDAVVAGDFGAGSTKVFQKAGVKQYILKDILIKEAIEKVISGGVECVDSGEIIASQKYGMGRNKRKAPEKSLSGFFICSRCGCSMPKKDGVLEMECPNCGNNMS